MKPPFGDLQSSFALCRIYYSYRFMKISIGGFGVFRLMAGSVVICGLLIVLMNGGYGKTDALAVSAKASVEPTTWARTELYFGGGLRKERGDYETVWNDYLDNVVTPRFPEGLTLIEATGQWRVKEGKAPRRRSSKIIILIHEATPEKLRNLDEIRSIWKEKSGHISVLKVTVPVEVSF